MNAVTPAHVLVLLAVAVAVAAAWHYHARVARFLQGASLPSSLDVALPVPADGLVDMTPQQAFDLAVAKAHAEAEKIRRNAIAQEMGVILIPRLTPIRSSLPCARAPLTLLRAGSFTGCSPKKAKPRRVGRGCWEGHTLMGNAMRPIAVMR